MDFRLDMHPVVSCSDASTSGGGICCSAGLSKLGELVGTGEIRGSVPDVNPDFSVLAVGLFDGISALRVALECLNIQVMGHVFVEPLAAAQRVVEANFPDVELIPYVENVTEDLVIQWTARYSQCHMVLLGGGPPCQGVSGLNTDRRGALKDHRFSFFTHMGRIRGLLQKRFRWCPVHCLMESVSSMDTCDRDIMTADFGEDPVLCLRHHLVPSPSSLLDDLGSNFVC